ncbi:OLC1v1002645C3 [Oldenlandia corymbosa var. corymbosa]|uniref:OLC1v1002645C3 n=1 Tax=Oldenlandia corymbosa var. corymbosa TaxID=529605 RepID=A0AAV1DBI4_OLDCO|nr:OLC1v1002645C3 [Oldenlandia corymbosa var. corymbosa]
MSNLSKLNVSNPKVWVVIGLSVAGIVILAETRRRKLKSRNTIKEDFGAFIEKFELSPFPQPPPPAAPLPLSGITFAIKDVIDVKGFVTGFGSVDWKKTHEVAGKTAVVVTTLLKNGATCVGKTIMDEFGFGITGENSKYGTPTNPKSPSHVPGGSSSGSAVAVAAKLVDFAIGTDSVGCIRAPASFCGVLGYRPSHGLISTVGVLLNSQNLDTIGCFARDPSILHRVGHVLLQLSRVELRKTRRLLIADDLFQLSKVPKWKTVGVVKTVAEKLSGYQVAKDMNFGQYISSNVPSLKTFCEETGIQHNSVSILKSLSSVMLLLHRYEFRTNHEEWFTSVKPRLGPHVSEAMATNPENIKILYKVRSEMRNVVQGLLKDDGILVIPTVADPPLKLNSNKAASIEFQDRTSALLSIASVAGCCQVSIPIGEDNGHPVSVSLIASHGADKFLLDTVLDMYSSLQEGVRVASSSPALPDTNGSIDAAELLKEKGNAAYKGKKWNNAVNYYSEAIKLNDTNATYFCNRAAAYLELGWFQQAAEDCTKALTLDKKNVKAYLRRGTARESLLFYQDALQDFKHALVLEPQNKVASQAEKRLKKLIS